jgi:anti-anti-sigma regulatory factor
MVNPVWPADAQEVRVANSAVTTRVVERTFGIVLTGEIAEAETADLRSVLVSAMRANTAEVLVDLAEATALDPTAIGALIAAAGIAADQEIVFRIYCPSVTLASELEAVGLEPVLSGGNGHRSR